MKTYISFPNNEVDIFLNKIDVIIRREKRHRFPKPFNVEVGDIFIKNKLQAKVISVDRKNKEVTVIPWGKIKMEERLFNATFFDWSRCVRTKMINSNGKIVIEDRIITEFFIRETIISIQL